MKIAIEGCCHGELDRIYVALKHENVKLLMICGDFQAIRNPADLDTISMPDKFKQMGSFYKYYSGAVEAPILTIFIGGNHEASAFLQELPYGGWVAKNIYYMGYANVINFAGLRIGGQSGIYYKRDYMIGRHEHPPYEYNQLKSVYHVRNIDAYRLKQISRPVDIFLSHDWPTGIYHYGNIDRLLAMKPFFRQDIETGKLGSPVAKDILLKLQPKYWFSAHLHVKFTAEVNHSTTEIPKITKFLALDKCLPRRKFLEVIDIDVPEPEKTFISLDPEWLSILQKTDHLLELKRINNYILEDEKYTIVQCPMKMKISINNFWDEMPSRVTVTDADINNILADFVDMRYKLKFKHTAVPLEGTDHDHKIPARQNNGEPKMYINSQTKKICTMLDLTNPFAVFSGKESKLDIETIIIDSKKAKLEIPVKNADEIDLDEDSSDANEDNKDDKDDKDNNKDTDDIKNNTSSSNKFKMSLPEVKSKIISDEKLILQEPSKNISETKQEPSKNISETVQEPSKNISETVQESTDNIKIDQITKPTIQNNSLPTNPIINTTEFNKVDIKSSKPLIKRRNQATYSKNNSSDEN